jgi:diguanylate cyclase (GGDEF)-like protein
MGGTRYASTFIHIWNMGVRLCIFLIVNQLLARLRFQLTREHDIARMDELTGVSNVRHFYEIAADEIERSKRYNHPLSVVYINIDNFKHINDLKGHPAGDCVLRELAQELRRNARTTDRVARVGGDEFVVLMPESNICRNDAVTKKMVDQLHRVAKSTGYHITFSIGVACFLNAPRSVEELIKEADDLMYAAKRSGKNGVEKKLYDL